ncbi:hypothetical protein QBC38DRAFT_489883 [Podospora fimiseda]|uniref:F-box domain-containing protein n=1 Tax=Podospora fimiseda TaxID=252190 RepID=A0AAN6YNL9_9PEZI|nr:hypothetical protein QBC38DRAFT_489883 [Podospora fimiseda]
MSTKSPLFHTLPLELLFEINSHLPSPSQISLTLTCKLALNILGKSSWAVLKRGQRFRHSPSESADEFYERIFIAKKARTDSLKLLSLDSCSYCKKCDILHPPLQPVSKHRINKHYTNLCWGADNLIDYWPFSACIGGGYSLIWEHIRRVMAGEQGVEELNGEFENVYRVAGGRVQYRLKSEGMRTPGNGDVVLRHVHRFGRRILEEGEKPGTKEIEMGKAKGQGKEKGGNKTERLIPADILELPFRICPHQSTATDAPLSSKVTKPTKKKGDRDYNGPFFTYTLVKAFPKELQDKTRTKKDKVVEFKNPTQLELKDMEAIDAGDIKDLPAFRCRSCPTKWKVEWEEDNEELKVTSWHCFYQDVQSAEKVWPWLVRTEATNLGRKRRNSEFWKQGRMIKEFEIDSS